MVVTVTFSYLLFNIDLYRSAFCNPLSVEVSYVLHALFFLVRKSTCHISPGPDVLVFGFEIQEAAITFS